MPDISTRVVAAVEGRLAIALDVAQVCPKEAKTEEASRKEGMQKHDDLRKWVVGATGIERVVAEQEAAGAKVWSKADFRKGDQVQDDFGRWHEVLRVNAKSVTVSTPYTWTETIPYDKVRGKRDGVVR